MIINLEGVNKSFFNHGNQIEILKSLNLNLQKGESVTILGQSGSGKSTLLGILGGTLKSDDGKVEVLGTDLSTCTEDELAQLRRNKLGMIFQHYHLIPHLSAIENVSLPLEIGGKSKEAFEKARSLLNDVGLSHREDHYPAQLSGGEKQRVAMARALIHDPELILADEPSGSLDEKTGDEVMGLMFDLVKKQQKGLILVTHNKSLGQFTDRILTLDHGVLV